MDAEQRAVAADELSALASLRAVARRYSRVEDETDDLLQDALLAAVRAGRGDLTQTVNYRWVVGTLKRLGAMTARSAARRRMRDERWALERTGFAALGEPLDTPATGRLREWQWHPALDRLPASLRQVAMLALSGHDRREIGWLLGLTGTALRQRIAALRRRLSAIEALPTPPPPGGCAASGLPLGLIRRALLPVVMASGSAGTHDPDGHLVILGRGRAPRSREAPAHVSQVGGNISS